MATEKGLEVPHRCELDLPQRVLQSANGPQGQPKRPTNGLLKERHVEQITIHLGYGQQALKHRVQPGHPETNVYGHITQME
jgi:hypothetical protein